MYFRWSTQTSSSVIAFYTELMQPMEIQVARIKTLRLQVEQQAPGKLLHLRRGAMAAGDDREDRSTDRGSLASQGGSAASAPGGTSAQSC